MAPRSRDDLQEVIALLKGKDLDFAAAVRQLPLSSRGTGHPQLRHHRSALLSGPSAWPSRRYNRPIGLARADAEPLT